MTNSRVRWQQVLESAPVEVRYREREIRPDVTRPCSAKRWRCTVVLMRVHQVHDEEERLPIRLVHQREGTAHHLGGGSVHSVASLRRVDVVHVKPAGQAKGRSRDSGW